MRVDALKEAQSFIIEATNVYGEYPDHAQVTAQMAQAYAAIAQAENASAQAHAAERMAESMERALPMLSNIAMHLGNIHQTLMTPDAEREPITVADLLKRIADALYGTYPKSETDTSVGNILKDIALDVSGIATNPHR